MWCEHMPHVHAKFQRKTIKNIMERRIYGTECNEWEICFDNWLWNFRWCARCSLLYSILFAIIYFFRLLPFVLFVVAGSPCFFVCCRKCLGKRNENRIYYIPTIKRIMGLKMGLFYHCRDLVNKCSDGKKFFIFHF